MSVKQRWIKTKPIKYGIDDALNLILSKLTDLQNFLNDFELKAKKNYYDYVIYLNKRRKSKES